MAVKTCPHCGKEIKETSKFCLYCGKKTDEPVARRFCANCGTQLVPGARACHNCGRMDGPKEPAAPAKIQKSGAGTSKKTRAIIIAAAITVAVIIIVAAAILPGSSKGSGDQYTGEPEFNEDAQTVIDGNWQWVGEYCGYETDDHKNKTADIHNIPQELIMWDGRANNFCSYTVKIFEVPINAPAFDEIIESGIIKFANFEKDLSYFIYKDDGRQGLCIWTTEPGENISCEVHYELVDDIPPGYASE